jgi:hypothetical protein
MNYCPHTPDDIKQMQASIGIAGIDELFADIPQKFRLKNMLDIPAALSELETLSVLSDLAGKNKLPQFTLTGAGAYHHFIPAVVGHITGRAEFYTAYTPYQAEISQGILQAIYEYQTMIAHLTGTEIANASMYDGASAMAEAAVLCAKMSNRTKIIVARSVHPEYRQVLRTYSWANGYKVVDLPYASSGQIDLNALQNELDDQVAAVLVQSPNFFGIIEDIAPIVDATHKKGALLVAGLPMALLWGFYNRRERQALILSWAKARVSAILLITVALIWGFLPPVKNLCDGYPEDLSAPQLTKMASADLCLHCKPANNTFAGKRRLPTFVPMKRSARWQQEFICPLWAKILNDLPNSIFIKRNI